MKNTAFENRVQLGTRNRTGKRETGPFREFLFFLAKRGFKWHIEVAHDDVVGTD